MCPFLRPVYKQMALKSPTSPHSVTVSLWSYQPGIGDHLIHCGLHWTAQQWDHRVVCHNTCPAHQHPASIFSHQKRELGLSFSTEANKKETFPKKQACLAGLLLGCFWLRISGLVWYPVIRLRLRSCTDGPPAVILCWWGHVNSRRKGK